MNLRHNIIIWDWNGTLLDDVDVCVSVMNELLMKRNLPLLTKEKYRKVFTFPIRNYYRSIGFDFDKEDFEKLAIEFIEKYLDSYDKFKLYKNARKLLATIKEKGYLQIILSASNKANLTEQLQLFGIEKYFSEIIGIDDHFAKSKKDHGKEILTRFGKDQKTIMIGDTFHDLEVANAIGCECILIANGHQDREILNQSNATIINELKEILVYL
jgi:phosphoglycolate phosphatase